MVGQEETLKLLSTFSEDKLKEFLHSCMDDLCGRKGPALVNLQRQTRYTADQFKEIITDVNALCCEFIATEMDHHKLKEKYPALSQIQCSVFHSCVTTRKGELTPYVNVEQLRKTDHLLCDYDWKLKWVVGSSTFSAVHEPLISLDLHLKSGKGGRTMNLELDKAELKHLIEALEKAQQSMFTRLTSA